MLTILARYYDLMVRRLSQTCGVIAALMMVVAVVVICQSVYIRYVVGGSSIWQTEFVTYLLIASTFLGSPYVLLTKGHVKVDLLGARLPRRGRRVLRVVSELITLLVLSVLAVTAVQLFHEAWNKGWKSESMWGVRLWIPYGAMMIGLILLALQSVSGLLDELSIEERNASA